MVFDVCHGLKPDNKSKKLLEYTDEQQTRPAGANRCSCTFKKYLRESGWFSSCNTYQGVKLAIARSQIAASYLILLLKGDI